MGAVQWWDHSRVRLDEYDQSLKTCKSMNIFYQPNRQTNPPKEILLRTKRSFLEQKPQQRKKQKQKHYTISKKKQTKRTQKQHKKTYYKKSTKTDAK